MNVPPMTTDTAREMLEAIRLYKAIDAAVEGLCLDGEDIQKTVQLLAEALTARESLARAEGAEAMREAAARVADNYDGEGTSPGDAYHSQLGDAFATKLDIAKAIRALPLPASGGWIKIDDQDRPAPRDGTRVDLWVVPFTDDSEKGGGWEPHRVADVKWKARSTLRGPKYGWVRVTEGGDGGWIRGRPTHYRSHPLPPPPVSEEPSS